MRIEKTVDRGSKQKLYVQIYSIFLEKIENGEWPEGTQIPPEDELCRLYDVSKITVREAIQELVREGYLKRQQGKGTFVTNSFLHLGTVMRTRLSEDDMYGEEVNVKKEILEKGVREATEDIKNLLMTEEGTYYVRVKKVIDGEQYSEEFFIPLYILPDVGSEDISKKSFYDLIEEKGTRKIFKVMQTMEITRIKEDTAAIFRMEEGSPALLMNRIFISADGSPIACSRLIGSGRKCKFRMEFERIK